jgi:hypothetical protein
MRTAAGAIVATILLWVIPFTAGAFCTDGVDCYCDRVKDPADSFYDPNLIFCEDFEDPTYENPDPDSNHWKQTWGEGTSPCVASTNNGTIEGATHNCRNILQRPGCPLYDAGNPDLNESGGHSTLNGNWDGCQSLYFPIRVGKSGGEVGTATGSRKAPAFHKLTTFSMTMAKKYSSNHFIGNQEEFAGNVKGDRYYVGEQNSLFSTFQGGQHSVSDIGDACTRGSSDPAFGYPASDKFPFASLLKAHSGIGILGEGACCDDYCYADDPGPSGPRIGIEHHDPNESISGVRRLMPPLSLWNPRVPGGVPMSVEGDKDGRDEWLCVQWTLQNHGTDQMNYYHWINNQLIMRFENLKGSADLSPFDFGFKWLNTGTAGQGQPKPTNQTSEDYVEVRDNYHLTASATPPSCAQVGFSFGP